MKRETKSRKWSVALSLLSVICCVSLIAGATFALFSDRQENEVSFSSGNVDVNASISLDAIWNVSVDGGEKNKTDVAEGQTSASFDPNGERTVSVSNGADGTFSAAMTNIAPGEGADFALTVRNSGTIKAKFTIYLQSAAGFDLGSLTVENYDDPQQVVSQNGRIAVCGWTELAGGGETTARFAIGLSAEVTESVNGSFFIVVEAYQYNASTEVIINDSPAATLQDALEQAASGAESDYVIEAGAGTHTLSEATELNGKNITILGNGETNTVIEGDLALNGGSLTVENATLNGTVSGSGALSMANASVNGSVDIAGETARQVSLFSAADGNAAAQVVLENVKIAAEEATALRAENVSLSASGLEIVAAASIPVAAEGLPVNAIEIVGGSADFVNSAIEIEYTYPANTAGLINSQTMLFHGADITFTDCEISVSFSDPAKFAVCGMRAENGASVLFGGDTVYTVNGGEQDKQGADAMRVSAASAEMRENAAMYVPSGPVLANGAEFTMSGHSKIDAYLYGLDGNNTEGTMVISLSDNASVVSHAGTAVYMPNQSTLTLNDNAYIKGYYSGIDAKMGTMNLFGGTVECNGPSHFGQRPADGTGGEGSAIVLHSHGYGVKMNQGNYEETGADNSMNVTLGENLTLVSENRFAAAYYDWARKTGDSEWDGPVKDGRVDQEVTIVNNSIYEIHAIGTDVVSLNRLLLDTGSVWYENVHFFGGDDVSDFTGDLGKDGAQMRKLCIWTAEGLLDLSKVTGNIYCDIELMADIDLGSVTWKPVAAGSRQSAEVTGSAFFGAFEGNKHTISNLTYNGSWGEDDGFGLFGVLNGGTIANVNFENVSIAATGGGAVGTAAGIVANGGRVANVHVLSGSLTAGDGVGGIVGRMLAEGSITLSSNAAAIHSEGGKAGGIVAAAYYTRNDKAMKIAECSNKGEVSSTAGYVGGIAGLSAADVLDCENSGAVIGSGTSIGGIVGEQQSTGYVEYCTNTAAITNHSEGYGTGGIVGWLRYSESAANYQRKFRIYVQYCMNSGAIDGGYDGGGIVGAAYNNALVEDCLNTAASITGGTFAAGIVGNMQCTETVSVEDGDEPVENDILVTHNCSTTAAGNISAANTDVYAYDNDGAGETMRAVENYASIETWLEAGYGGWYLAVSGAN